MLSYVRSSVKSLVDSTLNPHLNLSKRAEIDAIPYMKSENYKMFLNKYSKNTITIGINEIWHYYDTGPSAKIPLICLHGTSGTAEIFFQQCVALNLRGYRVLTITLCPLLTPSHFVSAFKKFLMYLDITEPIHILGASLGGYLALCFAEKYPKHVASLILTNAFCDTQYFKKSAPWFSMDYMPEFYLKRYITSGLSPDENQPISAVLAIDFIVKQAEQLTHPELMSRVALNVTENRVKKITIPYEHCTIIDPCDHVSLPSALRVQLYELLPGAVHSPMKEGGDFPYLSHSQEYTMLVQVHLRKNGLYHLEHKAHCDSSSPFELSRAMRSKLPSEHQQSSNEENPDTDTETQTERPGYFDEESSFDRAKKELFEDPRDPEVEELKKPEDTMSSSADDFDYNATIQDMEEQKKKQLRLYNYTRKPSIVHVSTDDSAPIPVIEKNNDQKKDLLKSPILEKDGKEEENKNGYLSAQTSMDIEVNSDMLRNLHIETAISPQSPNIMMNTVIKHEEDKEEEESRMGIPVSTYQSENIYQNRELEQRQSQSNPLLEALPPMPKLPLEDILGPTVHDQVRLSLKLDADADNKTDQDKESRSGTMPLDAYFDIDVKNEIEDETPRPPQAGVVRTLPKLHVQKSAREEEELLPRTMYEEPMGLASPRPTPPAQRSPLVAAVAGGALAKGTGVGTGNGTGIPNGNGTGIPSGNGTVISSGNGIVEKSTVENQEIKIDQNSNTINDSNNAPPSNMILSSSQLITDTKEKEKEKEKEEEEEAKTLLEEPNISLHNLEWALSGETKSSEEENVESMTNNISNNKLNGIVHRTSGEARKRGHGPLMERGSLVDLDKIRMTPNTTPRDFFPAGMVGNGHTSSNSGGGINMIEHDNDALIGGGASMIYNEENDKHQPAFPYPLPKMLGHHGHTPSILGLVPINTITEEDEGVEEESLGADYDIDMEIEQDPDDNTEMVAEEEEEE